MSEKWSLVWSHGIHLLSFIKRIRKVMKCLLTMCLLRPLSNKVTFHKVTFHDLCVCVCVCMSYTATNKSKLMWGLA